MQVLVCSNFYILEHNTFTPEKPNLKHCLTLPLLVCERGTYTVQSVCSKGLQSSIEEGSKAKEGEACQI